jgi:hypothetical protein
MTIFQFLNSKVYTWKNIIHAVTPGIDRYWPVLTGIWLVLTGIWPGTELGLFYTGLGTGTRYSGRYRNGIHNYDIKLSNRPFSREPSQIRLF